jgi:hypothetical protein
MLNPIRGIALVQLKSLLRGFLQECSLPFGSVLTVKEVVAMIQEELVETCDRIFTPLVTLCTFLSQIHKRRSLVPCGRSPAQCGSGRAGAGTLFAAHGRLLQGPQTPPGVAAATAAGLKRPAT